MAATAAGKNPNRSTNGSSENRSSQITPTQRANQSNYLQPTTVRMSARNLEKENKRFFVLKDANTSDYFDADMDSKKYFPECGVLDGFIATVDKRLAWETGECVTINWSNDVKKTNYVPVRIVSVHTDQRQCKAETDRLTKEAIDRSDANKGRENPITNDDADNSHGGQMNDDLNAPIDMEMDGNEDGNNPDAQGEMESGSSAHLKAIVSTEVKRATMEAKEILKGEVREEIRGEYDVIILKMQAELNQMKGKVARLPRSQSGTPRNTQRSRMSRVSYIGALFEEEDDIPQWMGEDVKSFINEVFQRFPTQMKFFTQLCLLMYDDDLFAFMNPTDEEKKKKLALAKNRKRKANTETTSQGIENDVENSVENGGENASGATQKKKNERKDNRMSISDRDPTGMSVYKRAAEQFFNKVILPERKLEYEQKRQEEAKEGNVLPAYNSHIEAVDRSKFVELKLGAMNDWGNDVYKHHTSSEPSMFRTLINQGRMPTEGFNKELDDEKCKKYFDELEKRREKFFGKMDE